MKSVDIAIVGAGMVGLTAALAITQLTDLKVAVIDSNTPTTLDSEPELRVSAISHASAHIFENLGVWQAIEQARLQPYSKMHVWDSNGYGKLAFDATELASDFDSLGWIIENKVIRNALYQQAEATEAISLITENITQLAQGESEVFITFAGQPPLLAKLIVGADGANSWLREQIAMPLTFRDYDHHALVATVELEAGHQNTAWQVFLDDGPLALLPLYQDNLVSIVWSQSPDTVKSLLSVDDAEFNKRIMAATDGRFGKITLKSAKQSFPLTMRIARDFVQERAILIGDAAHTIHPLAGQGVNLGLLDAVALAQTLAEPSYQLAPERALQAFSRWRKSEASDMIAAMEAIKQAFTPRNEVLSLVRGLGMSLLNELTPVKKHLALLALGQRDNTPKLAALGFVKSGQ